MESTHFIIEDGKILISPNLGHIISFLQEIEKEIETLLKIDKKLESIKKQYLEMLSFTQFLGQKLKENSIDFSYKFPESPDTIAEKLGIIRPVRSEMIVLFAHLEVLLCLNSAYDNKTSDDDTIRKLVMNQDTIKSFIGNFCLNQENEWGKKNENRLKHITVDDVRRLRNSLTHFFSTSKGLAVSHALLDEKTRRLEKATHFKAKFLSPEDLNEIISGSAKLMIRKWSDDCKKSITENSDDFKEKILAVSNVVKNHGVMVVRNNQISI